MADVDPIEEAVPLAELIAGLARPEALGLPAGTPVDVVQTHASVVFVAGDRVWKIKKPVRFWDLLDYGTVEARAHWCREEVRLNRRLAPDIYLGVEPVVKRDGALWTFGDGDVVEHAVIMRRFDESATLDAHVRAHTLTSEHVADVARTVARFHEQNRLTGPAAAAAVGRFETVLHANFEGTPLEEGALFPVRAHAGVRARLQAMFSDRRPLLESRARNARFVDGHGDIRLEHVLALTEPTIVDCVEFSEALRHVDGLSDLAFLSMDLVAAGELAHSTACERVYAEATGESDAQAVLPLYRGYRAYVRATVGYHAHLEPELGAETQAKRAEDAMRYFALAWAESRAGRSAPLILLHGLSGSGKSVWAECVAPLLRGVVLRSDEVRKDLAGMAPTDRPDGAEAARLYGAGMSARTYARLLEVAGPVQRDGLPVLLDATFLRRSDRDRARAAAAALDAPFAIVDVTCPPDVTRARLAARAARGDDPSDADLGVYLEQLRTRDPLADEEGHVVSYDSTRPLGPALMRLIDCLEAQP